MAVIGKSSHVAEHEIRSDMKAFASAARLQMLALLCCGILVSEGSRLLQGARAVAAQEPPLVGPALDLPPPPPVPLPDGPPKGPPVPVVKVTVRVPACSAPGKPIEYRLCVENCSPAEAHHVVLRNPLPANAEFVRAEPPPTVVAPELQWHLGTIGGGAVREICLVLQPTNADDVKNCTRVQFEHGQCVTTRQVGYPPAVVPLPAAPPTITPPTVMPPATDKDKPPVMPPATDKGKPPVMPPATDKEKPPPKLTIEELPKIELTIEGHPRQYVNLASHYFVTVTNTGKTRASNLRVSCRFPAQAQFVRGSAGATPTEGEVVWALGDLEPGVPRTVELVLKAQTEGTHCVAATAQADPNLTARADACTEFIGVSALHVAVSDRVDPVVVGGTTSYFIVLRNQGSAPLTNLKLKAFLPAALQFVDAKGPTRFQAGEKTGAGQWIEMDVLPQLDARSNQAYEIIVVAQRPGPTRLHAEVGADQLESGPVIEEEGTTVFEDQD
jgi:uncharacterized repeat protein (TIGR01451 family)